MGFLTALQVLALLPLYTTVRRIVMTPVVWARGERLDLPRMREIAAAYAERADPLSDLRGSAEYRRAVLPGLVVEALTRAVARENAAVLL